MKIASGCSTIILAILFLTCTPTQVESGPMMASVCIAGCKVALGACTGCGVAAASVTGGAAGPPAGWGCMIAYVACCGACTPTSVLPTP